MAKRLDHERQSSYSLVLQVQDSGSKPKIDSAEVSLLVLDTNDNAPEFEHSPYTVHVVEEMILDDPIFVVQGGFQLLDLIITELKSHMTCYNSMPLIG